jgi:cytosine/adenosine deaminase-related metal-dependent hydrolase
MIVPGAALHEELRLLAGAGIPPEDVMAIATRGSAGVFGVDGLGTLRPGAPADLAIFREDPTRDLAALDSLMAVVADGRVYTREMLDAQLERYRSEFDHPLSRNVATPAMRALLGVALRAVAGVGPGVPENGPAQPPSGDRG